MASTAYGCREGTDVSVGGLLQSCRGFRGEGEMKIYSYSPCFPAWSGLLKPSLNVFS